MALALDFSELDALLDNVASSLSDSTSQDPPNSVVNDDYKQLLSSITLNNGLDSAPEYLKVNENGVTKISTNAVAIIDDSMNLPNKKHKREVRKSGVLLELEKKKSEKPSIPGIDLDKQQLKKLKRETKGPGWFDMKSHEVTDEIKQDLAVLKARGFIDPKQHFKKSAQSKELPKFFQVGTIVDGPTDYYTSRVPRKERKDRLVEEVLYDGSAKSYLKNTFLNIQEVNQSGRHKGKSNGKIKKRTRR